MGYNQSQLNIITATEPHIVALSAAASGKTATLVGRIKHLLEIGVDRSKIVAITFTNAAAAEIMERVNRPADMFVGTIHSYCNYLLVSRGVDTSYIIEQEAFDRLFNLLKMNMECVREVEYLLLDEAQDSTELEFEFILDVIKPKNWMLFGDLRQSIYGFKGASPATLKTLIKKEDTKVYKMRENYRNDYYILDFAKNIIRVLGLDYVDDSHCCTNEKGQVITAKKYDPNYLARYIKKDGNYGSWFILTRTNDQVDSVCNYLKFEDVPYDTFKRAQLNTIQLNQKLKENTVKVLTIHAAKGLENDNVAVIGGRFYNEEERRICYVAATRAKHKLIWYSNTQKKKKEENLNTWET